MTDLTQRMREILEALATRIHNLSPGDVGSMDRVLLPIDIALAELSKLLDEAEEQGRLKGIISTYRNYDSIARDELPARIAHMEAALQQPNQSEETA